MVQKALLAEPRKELPEVICNFFHFSPFMHFIKLMALRKH